MWSPSSSMRWARAGTRTRAPCLIAPRRQRPGQIGRDDEPVRLHEQRAGYLWRQLRLRLARRVRVEQLAFDARLRGHRRPSSAARRAADRRCRPGAIRCGGSRCRCPHRATHDRQTRRTSRGSSSRAEAAGARIPRGTARAFPRRPASIRGPRRGSRAASQRRRASTSS